MKGFVLTNAIPLLLLRSYSVLSIQLHFLHISAIALICKEISISIIYIYIYRYNLFCLLFRVFFYLLNTEY